jgi:hypothetical protein
MTEHASGSKDLFTTSMRDLMARRVNISPTIEAMKSGTYEPVISLTALEHQYTNNPKAFIMPNEETNSIGYELAEKLWREVKEERNAALTIFTEEIWSSFANQRTIIPQTLHGSTARQLSHFTMKLFSEAVKGWADFRDSRLNYPESQWYYSDGLYHRLKIIVDFATRHGLAQPDTVDSFINRGVGTASIMIWSTMELIQTLAQENGIPNTKEAIFPIIEKSYGGIIVPLASMHIQNAAPILRAITGYSKHGQLDKNYFHLLADGDSWKLHFNHAMVMDIKTDTGEPILHAEPASITTWCPARYSKGDQKDVIREYFEWALDLLDIAHYQPRHRWKEYANSLDTQENT